MISIVARSPMGRALVEFADNNNLSDMWEDPKSLNIEAHVSGWKLDRQNPPLQIVDNDVNDELLVTLRSPTGDITVNLNDLLALATAYVRGSYARVRSALQPIQVVPIPSPSPPLMVQG